MKIYHPKAYIRLINRKQLQGKVVPIYTDSDKYICTNCNMEFEGFYCSNCGQSKDTPRFTYKSVIKNFFGGLTNIDSGFFFTIRELFVRPGYMISDYIGGRRVIYFRPLQMLFVLGAIYVLLGQAIDPVTPQSNEPIIDKETLLEFNDHNLFQWFQDSPFVQSVIGVVKNLFSSNKALEIACTLPIFALATHWAFRKRTYNKHYNLVELLFVRTYAASQLLIVSIVLLCFTRDASEGTPWWLDFLFSVWIYAQLFREKIGSTVKHTVLMYIYSLLIIILIAIIIVSLLVFLVWITDLFGVN